MKCKSGEATDKSTGTKVRRNCILQVFKCQVYTNMDFIICSTTTFTASTNLPFMFCWGSTYTIVISRWGVSRGQYLM